METREELLEVFEGDELVTQEVIMPDYSERPIELIDVESAEVTLEEFLDEEDVEEAE